MNEKLTKYINLMERIGNREFDFTDHDLVMVMLGVKLVSIWDGELDVEDSHKIEMMYQEVTETIWSRIFRTLEENKPL